MLDTTGVGMPLQMTAPAMRRLLVWVWEQKAAFILNAPIRGGQGFSIH